MSFSWTQLTGCGRSRSMAFWLPFVVSFVFYKNTRIPFCIFAGSFGQTAGRSHPNLRSVLVYRRGLRAKSTRNFCYPGYSDIARWQPAELVNSGHDFPKVFYQSCHWWRQCCGILGSLCVPAICPGDANPGHRHDKSIGTLIEKLRIKAVAHHTVGWLFGEAERILSWEDHDRNLPMVSPWRKAGFFSLLSGMLPKRSMAILYQCGSKISGKFVTVINLAVEPF